MYGCFDRCFRCWMQRSDGSICSGRLQPASCFAGTTNNFAQKDGAELLLPTVDTVTYEDGISEEVNGFDVPVPALDEPFNLALIGTKGKWYDHEVIVSNPEKLE